MCIRDSVRILRRFADHLGYERNFVIYDTDDQKSVIKEICKRLNIDTKIYKERALLSAISSAKNEMIDAKAYALNVAGAVSSTHLTKVRQSYGRLSGFVGICCNVMLFALKLFAGLATGAVSIMADAFNNLSDAASSVVTLIGFHMAGKPADPGHPYGHGRIEYLSGLFIAAAILMTGVELMKSSVEKILHPEAPDFSVASIIILVVSILLKLWMCRFNLKLGKRIQSEAIDVYKRQDETLLSHWKVERRADLPFIMTFETLLRLGGNMVIPGTGKNAHIYRQAAADMGALSSPTTTPNRWAQRCLPRLIPIWSRCTASTRRNSARFGRQALMPKKGCA